MCAALGTSRGTSAPTAVSATFTAPARCATLGSTICSAIAAPSRYATLGSTIRSALAAAPLKPDSVASNRTACGTAIGSPVGATRAARASAVATRSWTQVAPSNPPTTI
jgi:hypothetical protein